MENQTQSTPQANRLHIAFVGKRNAGKSSLINALTGQSTALVSDVPGTTTDPVYKSMELHPIGPVVLIDTAGLDDVGSIGAMRVQASLKALDKADIIVMVCTNEDIEQEKKWAVPFEQKKIPIVWICNQIDRRNDANNLLKNLAQCLSQEVIGCSCTTKGGIDKLIVRLSECVQDKDRLSIFRSLVNPGDSVLLVMPQDKQAPKGRLILPQVQSIRELLDKHCIVYACCTEEVGMLLNNLKTAPHLIVTDSQAFAAVAPLKPAASLLTSFSILFAAYKGDIDTFVQGAKAIEQLTPHSKVLIAEACTHAPLTEDIGREKIPAMLRNRVGQTLQVDVVSGSDYPDNLSQYDLIVHCGACMFNRQHVLSRIDKARQAEVSITNYGVAMAYLTGILEKVTW